MRADLAVAGGLLVLAMHAGLRLSGHHVRPREDAASRAPGGPSFRPSNSNKKTPRSQVLPAPI